MREDAGRDVTRPAGIPSPIVSGGRAVVIAGVTTEVTAGSFRETACEARLEDSDAVPVEAVISEPLLLLSSGAILLSVDTILLVSVKPRIESVLFEEGTPASLIDGGYNVFEEDTGGEARGLDVGVCALSMEAVD